MIPNIKSSYLHTSIQVSLTFKANFSYCLILEDSQTYFQLVPNLLKSQGSTVKVPSTFRLVPKTIYKPVLQYLCKLNPAEAAIISTVSQKYSILSKGTSNN